MSRRITLRVAVAPLHVMVPNPSLQAELTDLCLIFINGAGCFYIIYANSSIYLFLISLSQSSSTRDEEAIYAYTAE